MELVELGWIPVTDPYGMARIHPREYRVIQIFRHGWDSPQTLAWEDIHPAMNVNGLYWRPVKK